MPILTYNEGFIEELGLNDGDVIRVNFETGEVENLSNGKKVKINPFSEVQMEIYQNGGLF
jgi:3-isopropylmalate dehydratase small subunit